MYVRIIIYARDFRSHQSNRRMTCAERKLTKTTKENSLAAEFVLVKYPRRGCECVCVHGGEEGWG